MSITSMGRRSLRARLSMAAVVLSGLVAVPAFTGTSTVSAAAVDGVLDTTFNPGGTGANARVNSMAFAADGKIYIAGAFTQYNQIAVGGIARLNTDGTLDTTFNAGGAGFARDSGMMVMSIDVDSDGKIYAAGSFTSYNGATLTQADSVVRLNSDGTLDATFTLPRIESTNFVGKAASLGLVKKIGDLVFVSGSFDKIDPLGTSTWAKGIAAFTTAGVLDATFGANLRLGDGLSIARAYQIDKVPGSTDYYVMGSFRNANSGAAEGVVRATATGTVNAAFNTTTGGNNYLGGMAVLSDGKVLVTGNFTTYKSGATPGMVRLNTDGSVDTSFKSPKNRLIGAKPLVDSDGKIYVTGGLGTEFGTTNSAMIVRLNADGTLDTTFDAANQPNNYDISAAISPAKKLYVYGALTAYGSTSVGYLARVTTGTPPAVTTTTAAPTTTTTVASTVAGSTTGAASPGLVSNITAKVVGNTFVASWTAPTSGAAPTSYLATAVPRGVATSGVASEGVKSAVAATEKTCTATAPATTCTITGLQAGTKYLVAVAALNGSATSGGAFAPDLVTAKEPVVAAAKTAAKSVLPTSGGTSNMWFLLVTAMSLISAGAVITRRQRRA